MFPVGGHGPVSREIQGTHVTVTERTDWLATTDGTSALSPDAWMAALPMVQCTGVSIPGAINAVVDVLAASFVNIASVGLIASRAFETGAFTLTLPTDFHPPVVPSSPPAGMSSAVRDLRESSGLTWEQLGRLFGVSRRAVHHWSNGSRMTARHAEMVGELARLVAELPVSTPTERRDILLSPGNDGYSLFDQFRARMARELDELAPMPFTARELLAGDE